jgi:hypothetical protein
MAFSHHRDRQKNPGIESSSTDPLFMNQITQVVGVTAFGNERITAVSILGPKNETVMQLNRIRVCLWRTNFRF